MAGNPLIEIPSEKYLGPKMLALSPRHRAFVIGLLMNRGNQTRAAALAGYSTASSQGLRVVAHRVAHREDVQEAIQEEAKRRINATAIMATERIVEALDDGDPRIRLKAAKQILDSTGLGAVFKHEHHVEVESKTTRELLDFIKGAAREQGLDPKKLLGSAGVPQDVIDAEFEEVVSSTEGIEDLLG
jgi:phage terminase small subunit